MTHVALSHALHAQFYPLVLSSAFLSRLCSRNLGSKVYMGQLVLRTRDGRSLFKALFLPSCCFLRQETLLRIISLHSGVPLRNRNKTLWEGIACDGLAVIKGGGATGGSYILSCFMLQKHY